MKTRKSAANRFEKMEPTFSKDQQNINKRIKKDLKWVT